MKKVVLAYSGGLDTSCIVRWLKDRGYQVICFVADLGQGLGKGESFQAISKRAMAAGASRVYIKDLKDEFVRDFVAPAIKAGAIYEGKYLLATALGRPLIAKYLVDIAHKEKADTVSHGCTGKGNDQVRIEAGVSTLDPHLNITAPVRTWEFKSREEEIEYAKRKKIPIDVTKKKPYSVDRNLWGISIEAGVLEDITKEPPHDAYMITKDPQKAPSAPRYVDIYFEKGVPVKLNGKRSGLKDIIEKLNITGGLYGIGRTDLIENRLVGIKSREVYEAPAATIIHMAHKELESLVLDRELLHFKDIIALKYSELIYYGLWFSPLKAALDGFINASQRYVTGNIKIRLSRGVCSPASRSSAYSLYKKELSTYGKEDKFDQRLAEGFIKIWSMPYKR